MPITRMPHGYASFGFPQIGSGPFMSIRAANDGEIFFVEKNTGGDGNDGKSPQSAKKTIQAAVNACNHDKGSYVFVGEGNYAEQVTINKRGIHLIGMGAYRTSIIPAATMDLKGTSGVVRPCIAVQPTAISPNITQGIEITGIRVSGGGGYTGIYIGDGVDGTANASATVVHDCLIDGSNREGLYGIVIEGGSFIQIRNNLIVSWARAGVVVSSGYTRTAYYNVVRDNDFISGGTCGIAFASVANSNMSRNNAFLDDATTAFTSCLQVAALTGFSASTGTDNASIEDKFASAGTNGALLGASDHIAGSFARNAGDDASAYPPQTGTFGSL